MENTTKQGKVMEGEVVSDKMAKTVVVKITAWKRHPKYSKRFSVSRRFKAHDEKGEYHVGDIVEIVETRPISRHKKWKVVRKIK